MLGLLKRNGAVLVLLAAAFYASAAVGDVRVECGNNHRGTLASQGDEINYTFDGRAGERIAIGITKVGHSALFQPCWQLFDAVGVAIGHERCRDVQSRILRGQGPYRVRVRDHRSDGSGDFVLSLQPMSARLNGEPSCAKPIECVALGEASAQDRLAYRHSAQSYSFSAREGERVGIVVSKDLSAEIPQSSLFSPCWALLDAAGSQIGHTKCEASEEHTIPRNGSYTIRVFDHRHDGTGAFRLRLFPVGAYVNGSFCAAPIECNRMRRGTLEAYNDTHSYRFPGSAGQPVTIGISKDDPSLTFQPCWQLRDLYGSAVGYAACEAKQQRTLRLTAPHVVHVFDHKHDGAGAYRLTVDGSCAAPQ